MDEKEIYKKLRSYYSAIIDSGDNLTVEGITDDGVICFEIIKPVFENTGYAGLESNYKKYTGEIDEVALKAHSDVECEVI